MSLKQLQTYSYPARSSLLQNRDAVIQKLIVGSYAPPHPIISNDAVVACIGSCFAERIAESLAAQGRQAANIFLSEQVNTPVALRVFAEHAFCGVPIPEDYGMTVSDPSAVTKAGAFIISLGLSLPWVDRATQRPVLQIKNGHQVSGLLAAMETHDMVQMSVGDTAAEIRRVLAAIRTKKPNSPVILTLSPVPLTISKTDYPPVVSNTRSKATLHCAIHEVISDGQPDVYYWPSYEIVEWTAKHFGPVWGHDGDLRHIDPAVVQQIMDLFGAYYFIR